MYANKRFKFLSPSLPLFLSPSLSPPLSFRVKHTTAERRLRNVISPHYTILQHNFPSSLSLPLFHNPFLPEQVVITLYWLGRKVSLSSAYHGPQLNLEAFKEILDIPVS